MKRISLILVIASILSLGAPSAISAQIIRQGLWGTAGASYTTVGCQGEGCGTDETGFGPLYEVGYFLSNQLSVSGSVGTFDKKFADGLRQRDVFWSVNAVYYPSPTGHLFITGGMGRGSSQLSDDSDFLEILGSALAFGIGLDIPIGTGEQTRNEYFLVPYARYFVTSGGELTSPGFSPVSGYNAKMLQLGIGISSRTRPKR